MESNEITPQVFSNRFADAVGPSEGGPARDHCRCVGHSVATRPDNVVFHPQLSKVVRLCSSRVRRSKADPDD